MSDYDEQCSRIQSVFDLDEIPEVNAKNIAHYFQWLKLKLRCPCILTGIESMGYFSWEEPYDFGYGSERDYARIRKERGSFKERYELKDLKKAKAEGDWDILAPVVRVSDKKRFTIPLSELQAEDESSENHQILDDYTVWYINWR